MSRALVTPLARSSAPSTSLKCWWLSHNPGIRKRPCASMISASADGLISASGPTRTMRSPRTSTLVAGVTLRSRGSNRRALRMTRSPCGTWARARAMRSDHAASVFCCAVAQLRDGRLGSSRHNRKPARHQTPLCHCDRARSIAAKSPDR